MTHHWGYGIILIGTTLVLSSLALASMAQVDSGSLTVQITGMKSDEGHLVYAMWSGSEGWLESNTVREGTSPISAGGSTLKFDDLPYGEYAISVYHDKNDNGKLDTGMFRIPKEPLGTSNDAKIRFGPPKYDDAVFFLEHLPTGIQPMADVVSVQQHRSASQIIQLTVKLVRDRALPASAQPGEPDAEALTMSRGIGVAENLRDLRPGEPLRQKPALFEVFLTHLGAGDRQRARPLRDLFPRQVGVLVLDVDHHLERHHRDVEFLGVFGRCCVVAMTIEQANAEGEFPQFDTATISALYNVNEGERGLVHALDRIRVEAADAAERGVPIRSRSAAAAPISTLRRSLLGGSAF